MARPTKSTPSRAGKAASKPTKAATRPTAKQAAASPSKDELRARVEKLERANTILRTKNRAGLTSFHEASDRVTELEAHVAKLELQLSRSTDAKAKPASAPVKQKRTTGRRQRVANSDSETNDNAPGNENEGHSDADEPMSANA